MVARRIKPPAVELHGRDPELLAIVRDGWQRLYTDERDSVVAAAYAAVLLGRLAAPPVLLAEVATVIADEAYHVEVCATVIVALGGEPRETDPGRTRVLPASVPLDDAAARLCVVGFGVGESMSAASFARARELATEPIARWAYTEILRDEARHGGFGMRSGAWVMRTWSTERREALWPGCVGEMEEMERRAGGPIDAAALAREANGRWVKPLEALGILRPSIVCDSMIRGVERTLVPRLRAIGVVASAPPR